MIPELLVGMVLGYAIRNQWKVDNSKGVYSIKKVKE